MPADQVRSLGQGVLANGVRAKACHLSGTLRDFNVLVLPSVASLCEEMSAAGHFR